MRRKLIVGNWKMHKVPGEALRDFNQLMEILGTADEVLDIGIAAPTLALPAMAAIQKSGPQGGVRVYAQNCHWERQGAFTGEISTAMLADIRVHGSLVAHSERRQYFGETDDSAGKRMGALLRAKMECILCVGETLEERDAGNVNAVLKRQLSQAFSAAHFSPGEEMLLGHSHDAPPLSIAYEPVWAIGTGRAASAAEAQSAHAYIRTVLVELLGHPLAQRLRLLYGGSVKSSNIADFVGQNDVDGALVGGASLEADEFAKLCRVAAEVAIRQEGAGSQTRAPNTAQP